MVPSAPMRAKKYQATCGEGPLLGAVGVDRVELAVIRPDVDGAVGADRRRGMTRTTCGEGPLLGAVGVDGVELLII